MTHLHQRLAGAVNNWREAAWYLRLVEALRTVMIDASYDREVFNVTLADVPERKQDLVHGRYEIAVAAKPARVAVGSPTCWVKRSWSCARSEAS